MKPTSSPGQLGLRLELVLLAFFSLAWLLAIIGQLGLLPLAGTLRLELYPLYSLATVLGWISGNVYVTRRRVYPSPRLQKRVLISYLCGPPSLLYLLRALAPLDHQRAAPLVPVYAFMVYAIFFLVPVTLKVQPRKG